MSKIKLFLLFFIVLFSVAPSSVRAAVLDFSGYAWSDNIGWISFNSNDPGASGAGNYKVSIDDGTGRFSGNAWSDNIGWISFDRALTGAPPSDDPCPGGGCIARATPPGQIGTSDTFIKGWARALSYGGGWDGWIRLDQGGTQKVYINTTYDLRGWAWGSDVVGWISFNSNDPWASGVGNYSVGVGVGGGITHKECGPGTGLCIDLPGPGADLCNNDNQCKHKKCVALSCNTFPNVGSDPALEPDLCNNNNDCFHRACNAFGQCVNVAGAGADSCNNDGDCSRYECDFITGSCNSVPGSGADQCNPFGIMDCKPPILWKWWEAVPKE
ncbi:hypothetical protein ACFLZ0_01250 [Patescibacteria group bacterium]